MIDIYGPREATVDDVVDAITDAMQTRYGDPGWRSAGEHVDATDGNHVRPVQREAATAAEAWSALNREGPGADAVRSYLAPGPQPRYDTAEARDEALADREAGGPVSTVYGPPLATWEDVEAARDAGWEALTGSGPGSAEAARALDGALATHDGYRLGLARPVDWEAGQ